MGSFYTGVIIGVSGTVVAVIWKRRWDKGRIFYCSIGRRLDDLKVPQVTEIIKRGIHWVAAN